MEFGGATGGAITASERLYCRSEPAYRAHLPIRLFSRRAALVLVLALVLMQVGIRVTMGPDFPEVMLAHLFWIP
jgi:hypothetical protein